jgi:hypothetical protein
MAQPGHPDSLRLWDQPKGTKVKILLNQEATMYCTYVSSYIGTPKHDPICSVSFLLTRVAKWFVFKPKIPIWVYFGGP